MLDYLCVGCFKWEFVCVDEFDCVVFLFLGYCYGSVGFEFAEVDSCVVAALLCWLFEVCVGF